VIVFIYSKNEIQIMSSKSKLITSIVLLILSVGLLPPGFILNKTFVDQVYAGVPDALLGIQEEALPSLEDQIPGLATPDVLLGVEVEAVSTLESQLPGLATPEVLLGVESEAVSTLESQLPGLATPEVLRSLKDEAIAQLPAIINGSGAAQAINGTIDYAALVYMVGYPTAKDDFFNSIVFSSTYLGLMQGASEYSGMSFGYTVNAQNYLLYGNGPMPGLITDLELGLGVLGYMGLYLNASLGNLVLQGAMQLYYNASWLQLTVLAGYIANYLWDVVVKSTYAPTPIEIVAEMLFYAQWANASLVSDGIDLSLFNSNVPPGTKGLEAGIPTSTDIMASICANLWDDSNPLSFTNDNGIMPWIGAMLGNTTLQGLLISTFSLSPTQLSLVLAWLGNFISVLTPLLIFAETGYTIPDVAQLAFYEQWANGTIMGASILPEGFLSQLDPSFAGAPYFEVGLPTSSDLLLSTTTNLWDDTNLLSFTNDSGIITWIGAMQGNTTLQASLSVTFSLDPTHLSLLLFWLGSFITVRVPQLLEYDTGNTVSELAQLAFYEQWANGTIMGTSILPEGFLSQLDSSFAGSPYFEVALTVGSPTGLSIPLCMSLWNDADPYTFVNTNGIPIWLGAISNSTLQTLLGTKFGLAPAELSALLTWLGAFYTVRVPQLLLYDTGLTVPELAQFAFYEQWANGTINGESLLPDGFLSERDPPIFGPPFFELALTSGKSGLSVTQTALLWDEANDYSLVSSSGIEKWYNAESDIDVYTSLKTNNGGLSDSQMARILDWLPQFRDIIVNVLAKDNLGLPMEPYQLGNAMIIGFSSAAGVLALVGVILLILSKRT
jgi:hypothetical protein